LHVPHFPQDESIGKTQAPAPSQVDWQGGVPLPQSLSGSVPMGMGLQVPTVLASLHETQVPVQALLQQNPVAAESARARGGAGADLAVGGLAGAGGVARLVAGAAARHLGSWGGQHAGAGLARTLQDLHGPEHEARITAHAVYAVARGA